MATAEIHDAQGNYAGYAVFGADGSFQGTRGGYGPQGRGINPDRSGNNRRNNASMVQNRVNSSGARQAARRARAFNPFR